MARQRLSPGSATWLARGKGRSGGFSSPWNGEGDREAVEGATRRLNLQTPIATKVGAVTDRDITVRAVATGAAPTARVVEFLSRDALVVRADDDLKVALDLMSSRQVRRLPVVDKDGRLVGVVSLGDLSTRVKEKYAGEALEEISRSS